MERAEMDGKHKMKKNRTGYYQVQIVNLRPLPRTLHSHRFAMSRLQPLRVWRFRYEKFPR